MRLPRKDRTLWHPWFAWYPHTVDQEYVWLEWLEVRYEETEFGLCYYIRLPQKVEEHTDTR